MEVGLDQLIELTGAPPLSAKLLAGATGPELVIVSSAASLLEGDELSIELVLRPGARLTVTSAAAQMAFPCLHGGHTTLDVRASVGAGAILVWRPEPLIVCAGADHRSSTAVNLAGDASVLWCDEVLLGRTGDDHRAARLTTRTSFDRDGEPVVRDGLRTHAPGAFGPAVLGTARYLVTVVEVGGDLLATSDPPAMDLAAGGRMFRLMAPTSGAARAAVLALLATDPGTPPR